MEELTTLETIALIASPALAAIAAGASWASVFQARRLGREANAPNLQIQITAHSDNTIGAVVTNAGNGMARGTLVLLAHPPYFVLDSIGHGFMHSGQTVHVVTGIQIIEGVETRVIASCRDRDSYPHAWSAQEKHRRFTRRVTRKPRYQDIRDVFRTFYPDVEPRKLTQVPMTVVPDPPATTAG